jgi:hypothetical protein
LLWRATERVRRARALRGLYKSNHRKDAPEARGLRLLRTWLSPEQCAQLDALGHFDVTGSVTGKKYRIYFGISANVQEIGEDGSPRAGWCFVPDGYLVPGDVMLAQKIALETSEAAALAVANRFPVTIPGFRRDAQRPF